MEYMLFQLRRPAPGLSGLHTGLGEQGAFFRGDEQQIVVQQVKGLGEKGQARARRRLCCLGLGELIAPGQKVGRCIVCCALLERRLRAGPPGQSTYGLAPSRGAWTDFALGVRTKKQGEPRPTRYRLRRKHEERYE